MAKRWKKVSRDLILYLEETNPVMADLVKQIDKMGVDIMKTREGMRKGMAVGKYSPEAIQFIAHKLKKLSEELNTLARRLEKEQDDETKI